MGTRVYRGVGAVITILSALLVLDIPTITYGIDRYYLSFRCYRLVLFAMDSQLTHIWRASAGGEVGTGSGERFWFILQQVYKNRVDMGGSFLHSLLGRTPFLVSAQAVTIFCCRPRPAL